jgi:hypothetical protein
MTLDQVQWNAWYKFHRRPPNWSGVSTAFLSSVKVRERTKISHEWSFCYTSWLTTCSLPTAVANTALISNTGIKLNRFAQMIMQLFSTWDIPRSRVGWGNRCADTGFLWLSPSSLKYATKHFILTSLHITILSSHLTLNNFCMRYSVIKSDFCCRIQSNKWSSQHGVRW